MQLYREIVSPPGRMNFRRIMNGCLGTFVQIGIYTPRRECNETTGQDNEVDDDNDEPSWRLVNDIDYNMRIII